MAIRKLYSSRKIPSLIKKEGGNSLRADPLRIAELLLIGLGTIVSASSSYFAWQAASSAAEQAQYAQKALSSADTNATFRAYIASWNKLCRQITPPEYKLYVGTPLYTREYGYSVLATNTGFDPALFDMASHNKLVQTVEDEVRNAALELQTFLPEDVEARPDQALLAAGYFQVFRVVGLNANELQTRLIKASAICHYYTEQQMRWFKNGFQKIEPILMADMEIEYVADLPSQPKSR